MKIKYLFLFLSFLVLTIVTSNINWGKEKWKRALESDAKGFYAYNPALFIYQDPQFSFWDDIDKKYNQEHLQFDYRSRYKEVHFTNKFFVGTSVLQMPFFLGAHLITKLQNGDVDGYSRLYMRSIQIATICYAILGLFYLFQLLEYYNVSTFNQIAVAFAILFGTNAFIYTIVEAGMSHIYSFFLISLFLSVFLKWIKFNNNKYFVLLSAILALVVLCRPTNILIVLFLPFISLESFLKIFKVKFYWWLLAFLIFSAIISIQLIWYYAGTGILFHYSYEYETFDFSNPQLIKILFSYKKGLFLYTPMYLLSLFGFWFFFKESKFKGIYYLSFFLLITYVFSSWWMWYYGGSFSSRVYVDYLAIFAIPLAKLLEESPKKLRVALISLVLVLVVLCQIQSYQYRYYIIHYSDMTKELYWNNFLKLSK